MRNGLSVTLTICGIILFGILLWEMRDLLPMLGELLAVLIIAGMIFLVVLGWLFVRKTIQALDEKALQLRRDREMHALEKQERAVRVTALALAAQRGFDMAFENGATITAPRRVVEAATGPAALQAALPLISQSLQLPGACTDLDILRRWDLRPDHLFLALGKGNAVFGCTLAGLCHVAHDASTGGGKTSQVRLEIAMLLKVGATVLLGNPHFAPVDRAGLDWRPIAAAIERQGLIDLGEGQHVYGLMRHLQDIRNTLAWLSLREIDRRFTLQARGNFGWSPLYFVIDELPVLTKRFPECADYLVDIIQRGRAVDVLAVTNAQSFLVDNTGLSGGARENFNTAYFLGGSTYSGAVLLDMTKKMLESTLAKEGVALGKGVGMLRNNEAVPQAQLVRLPKSTNEGLYYLLGRADGWELPEFRQRGARPEPMTPAPAIWGDTDGEITAHVPERATGELPVVYEQQAARPKTTWVRAELEAAARAWNSGANSVRKLQDALALTNYQATMLRRELVAAELIEVSE